MDIGDIKGGVWCHRALQYTVRVYDRLTLMTINRNVQHTIISTKQVKL